MNYYETLYIIHPALDGGRIKELILSISEIIEENNGKPISLDVWGKKKLAYEIDKQKYGTYVLSQFSSDGSGNAKLNMELEHNPNILAYLTIKIDEDKILEQTLSLEDQIKGENPSQAINSSPDKQSPVSKESPVEESAIEKNQNTDEPVTEDSPVEESATEEGQSTDEPITDDSPVEESAIEEGQSTDEPVTDDSPVEEPTNDNSLADESEPNTEEK